VINLKPTKKVIAEFPSIEKEFVKRYNEFKNNPTTRNLTALAIYWGKWSEQRQIFNLESKLTEQQITDIYLTMNDYSKDIQIF